MQMHAGWGINMVSSRSVCSCKAMILLGTQQDVVGWLPRLLEWNTGGIQAPQEGQDGKMEAEEGALYMREQLECIELCQGMDEEPTKSLCVRRQQVKVTLQWVSAAGHLTGKWMRSSADQ